MRNHLHWLRGEIDAWVARGLIAPDQAKGIRDAYPIAKESLPWGMITFMALGAAILGLGVILLFAYNWQAMPKILKLAVLFLGLSGAHASGIWIFFRRDDLRGVGEGLCVLGTMLFGAGIWLVAQIYHIEEHFPNGILLWAIGAITMAWTLPSVAQGMLAAVLLAVWAGAESLGFRSVVQVSPVLIAGLLVPLAWLQRSRVLLAVVIPAVYVTAVLDASVVSERLVPGLIVTIAAALVAGAMLARKWGGFPDSAPIFALCGWAPYIFTLYLITFPDLAGEAVRGGWRFGSDADWVKVGYFVAPLVLALAAWGLVAWPRGRRMAAERRSGWSDYSWDAWLVPVAILVLFGLQALQDAGGFAHGVDVDEWPCAAAFNLILLAHAVAFLVRGSREGLLLPTALGAILLVALGTARFFDLFQSLVARGLTFVIVGGALIASGILCHRARRTRKDASS